MVTATCSSSKTEAGRWAALPHDLLGLVVRHAISPRDHPADKVEWPEWSHHIQGLSLVCKSWRLGVQLLVEKLQPTHVGPTPNSSMTLHDAWRFKALSLPVSRSCYGISTLVPHLSASLEQLLSGRFSVSLRHLALPGHALPDSLISALPTAYPLLEQLDLACCTLSLASLSSSISQLKRLRTLKIPGIRTGHHGFQQGQPNQPVTSTFLLVSSSFARAAPGRLHPHPTANLHLQNTVPEEEVQQLMTALATLPALTTLDISRVPQVLSPPYPPSQTALIGLPLEGQGGALSQLAHLEHLDMAYSLLAPQDYHAVGQMSHLKHLGICWDVLTRPTLGWPAGRAAPTPDDWQLSLAGLKQLTSLSIDMHGSRATTALSLAHLTHLTRLSIAACTSLPLALSILGLTGLRSLALTHTPAWVFRAELILQLAAHLTALNHLDLSYSRYRSLYMLPGDVLLQGLALVRPQLQTLDLTSVDVHGTGLPASPPGTDPDTAGTSSGGGQLQCTHLVLHSSNLLMCNYARLGNLPNLEMLTLTGMRPQHLVSVTRTGGLAALSALTRLTHLSILGPPRPLTCDTWQYDHPWAEDPHQQHQHHHHQQPQQQQQGALQLNSTGAVSSTPPCQSTRVSSVGPQFQRNSGWVGSSGSQSSERSRYDQSLVQELSELRGRLQEVHDAHFSGRAVTGAGKDMCRTWVPWVLGALLAGTPPDVLASVHAHRWFRGATAAGALQELLGLLVWHTARVGSEVTPSQDHTFTLPVADLLHWVRLACDRDIKPAPETDSKSAETNHVPYRQHSTSPEGSALAAGHAGGFGAAGPAFEQQDEEVEGEEDQGGGGMAPGLVWMEDEEEADDEEEAAEVQEGEGFDQGGESGTDDDEVDDPELLELAMPEGQMDVVRAVSQARSREPYLHFISNLPQLQSLTVDSLSFQARSFGAFLAPSCLGNLPVLRHLALQGNVQLTRHTIAAFSQVSLPCLESFNFGTCVWRPVETNDILQPPASSTSCATTQPGTSSRVNTSTASTSRAARSVNAGASTSAGPSASRAGNLGHEQPADLPPSVSDLLMVLPSVMPALQHLSLGHCSGLRPSDLAGLATSLTRIRYVVLWGVLQDMAAPQVVLPALSHAPHLRYARVSVGRPEQPGGSTLVRCNGHLQVLP